MNQLATQSAYRWNIVARIFAAIILGYILANTASVFLGFILPMTKVSAVLTALLLGFALYTCIVMWIFHVNSMKKMWWSLAIAIVVTAGGSWLLYLIETQA